MLGSGLTNLGVYCAIYAPKNGAYMKKKKLSDRIAILERRINGLRAALADIAHASRSDNPYAEPIDRTYDLMDTADYALKEDDKLND